MSNDRTHVMTCPTCGKRCYTDKKRAKRAARAIYPGDRMNAYPCGPYWHIGHLPRDVVAGLIGREDIYPTRRPQ